MLFTTLRQLASISGRTIVAIGLTSATVLALAPSAKAADPTSGITVNVPEVVTVSIDQPSITPDIATITSGTTVGVVTAQNNKGVTWYVYASSSNNGFLVNGASKVAYTISTVKGGSYTAGGTIVTDLSLTSAKLPIYTGTSSETGAVTFEVKAKTATGAFNSALKGDHTDTITYSMVSP